MELKYIKYEKKDHLAYITFNRPEVMNAMHPPCHIEMDGIWDDFVADKNLWVAIVTGAGLDTEHLALRLAPAGIIAGRVLDESGEPVRNATVTIYFDDHSSGFGQVRQFHGAQTDDQGDYEIASLMPGTYFLSASATPWYAVHPNRQTNVPDLPPASVDPSLDVTYPLTYYGDETAAEDATPIPIRGGERLQADIHLNPAHALSLRFRVPTNEQGGFRVPQLQQSSF